MPAHVITSEQQRDRMLHTPIPRLILSLCLPTLATQLISVFYNTADTYFVSKLSTSASAAVGVVFSLMSIIQAFGFGIGMGCGSIISRSLGGKDNDRADRIGSSAFVFAAAVGLALCAAGLCTLRPLMRLLGSTDTILPYAESYARIILLAAPVMCASFVLSNVLRAEGEATLSMYGMCVGGLLNVGLDPLFIFVFEMGIAGAALATALSQLVSFLILGWQFLHGRSIVRLRLQAVSRSPRDYGQILLIGFPTICRQGFASLSSALLNNAAAAYSDAAVAAVTISNKVYLLVRSMIIGIGQGFQPVAGYNFGAKRYDRVRGATYFTILVGTVLMSVLAAAGFLAAPGALALFRRDDAEVIAIGALALRAQYPEITLEAAIPCPSQPEGWTGQSGQATFLSLCRQGIFFVPFILLLPQLIGLLGVQLAQPAADLCTFAVTLPFLLSFLRRLKLWEQAERAVAEK